MKGQRFVTFVRDWYDQVADTVEDQANEWLEQHPDVFIEQFQFTDQPSGGKDKDGDPVGSETLVILYNTFEEENNGQ